MSKGFLLSVLICLSFKLLAQPQLKFADAKQNFGFVKNGKQIKLLYVFTNTGNKPLIILDAGTECSCTKVTFPKEPIPPGKLGTIEVNLDTSPAHGRQNRIVEVTSNDNNSPHKIRFKGVVLD